MPPHWLEAQSGEWFNTAACKSFKMVGGCAQFTEAAYASAPTVTATVLQNGMGGSQPPTLYPSPPFTWITKLKFDAVLEIMGLSAQMALGASQ